MSRENEEKLAQLARKKAREHLLSSEGDMSVLEGTKDNTLDVLGRDASEEKQSRLSQGLAQLRKSNEEERERQETSVWKPLLHKESGRVYYWNTATNETSWERPAEMDSVAEAKEEEEEEKQQSKEQLEDRLLSGWRKEIHPSTKQAFYFNEETGEKVFQKPTLKWQREQAARRAAEEQARQEEANLAKLTPRERLKIKRKRLEEQGRN